jgi:hypothetical protein
MPTRTGLPSGSGNRPDDAVWPLDEDPATAVEAPLARNPYGTHRG